jgi:hypothetical protein
MIHFHAGTQRASRVGLLFGLGTYSYLPFDCRIGRVAAHLSNLAGSTAGASCTVSLLQNGSVIGDPATVSAGVPKIWRPYDDVLPGVTTGNVGGAGKLSLGITGGSGDFWVRFSVELLPVDAALSTAEIWTLYCTDDGDWATMSNPHSLLTVNGDDLGIPPLGTGEARYASGITHITENYGGGIFVNPASEFEQAESQGPGGTQAAGTACPLARSGKFSHLKLISADSGGFDGQYVLTLRQNGADTAVTVTSPTDGTRIVSSANTVTMPRGAHWDWELVANSGSELKGHIVCAFTPDGTETAGAGLGAFGLGARGMGDG